MRAGFTYALAGALVATALAVLINLPARLLGPADGGRPVRIADAEGTTIEAAPPRVRPVKPQAHSTPKTHTATAPPATHIASLHLATAPRPATVRHAAATQRLTAPQHVASHPVVHMAVKKAARPITAQLPKSIRARSAVVTHLTVAPKRKKITAKPAATKRVANPTTTATTTTTAVPTPAPPPIAAVNAPVTTSSSSSPSSTPAATPTTTAAPAATSTASAPAPASPTPVAPPVTPSPIVTHVQTGREDDHGRNHDGGSDHGQGRHH